MIARFHIHGTKFAICVIVFVVSLNTDSTNTMKIFKIVLYILYISLIVFYQIANSTIILFCLFLVLANTNAKKAPTKDTRQMNEKIVQNFKNILYGTPLFVEMRSSIIKPISIIETKIQFILKYESGLYLYQLVLNEGKRRQE